MWYVNVESGGVGSEVELERGPAIKMTKRATRPNGMKESLENAGGY